MLGEIYDFDNAIYPDPEIKNEVFLRAAIEAAILLRPNLSKEVIEEKAKNSYKKYGTDFGVFVEEFDIPISEIHPLYHRLAMEEIFDAVNIDEDVIKHFEGRLLVGLPFSIVTHGSLEWLLHGLKKLKISNLFRQDFLYAVDMPEINYRHKHESNDALCMAARAMGLKDISQTRFFDDSRKNLKMAREGCAETVLVHWGHDIPQQDDQSYISRKVNHISDYTL
jgi:hypothetical protein